MSDYPLPAAARALPAALHPLLRTQRAMATLQQLTHAGVTREQVRWGLTRSWTSPLRGVIRLTDAPMTSDDRVHAAVLAGGRRCLLGGPSAAAWLGVVAARDDATIHLVVPGQCQKRRIGWAHLAPSIVPDPAARTIRDVPTCSLTRAVVDAARWSTTDDKATAIVIEACQRGLATPSRLGTVLEAFGTAPGTARARRAIEAASTGAWSVPEYELLRLLPRTGIATQPWLNPTLVDAGTGVRLISPDMWFDDVGLAVMVHSKAHHRMGEDWVRTVEADSELTARGVVVVGITPTTIRRDPRAAVETVRGAYDAASSRPWLRRVHARIRGR